MIKRFVIALVLVVLVCGGLVGFNMFRSKMIGEFFANQQVPAATVSAMTVEASSWTPAIEAIGTLWSREGVDVAVQVAGVVRAIDFNANDQVSQDQLLVQIDDAVERAELQSAQAAVVRDRASLERAQTLRKTGVSSVAALEDAQTALATSESTLARLEAVIDQKAVNAPFAGTIGIPRIDVGQYVQPGTIMATLQQLDTMRVDFTVPEQQMADVKVGQPASFGLTEGEFPYPGTIVGVDPKIDPQTRLISVRAEVSNAKGELRPGQFVRVRVDLPAVADVIALPQTSVVTSLYGDYVYLVENAPPPGAAPADEAAKASPAEGDAEPAEEGKEAAAAPTGPAAAAGEEKKLIAKQAFVQLGRRQGNLVEIREGVTSGQQVVTSGQNKLFNNIPVVINNKVDPAAVALETRTPKS